MPPIGAIRANISGKPELTGDFLRTDEELSEYLVHIPLSEPVDDQWITLLNNSLDQPITVGWDEDEPSALLTWFQVGNPYAQLDSLARAINDANETHRRVVLTLEQQIKPDLDAWWRDRRDA